MKTLLLRGPFGGADGRGSKAGRAFKRILINAALGGTVFITAALLIPAAVCLGVIGALCAAVEFFLKKKRS